MNKSLFNRWKLVILGLVIFLLTMLTLPAQGAERIYINTGLFNFAIPIKAVESFAKEGKIEKELAFILNRLHPQQQTQLRDLLRTRYPVNPVMLYRLGNSYAGHQLLNLMGKAVQIPNNQNGYYPLRGAIISSSLTPEGVSVINVLKNFSTNVQLNINYILKSFKQIDSLIKETNRFIQHIKKSSIINTPSPSLVNSQPWANLLRSGQFNISRQIVNLQDDRRNRSLRTILYLPQTDLADLPVIFISDGLGSDGEHFAHLADHLASHGFAVVIIEHPNSNGKRQDEFYRGLYKDPFDATEFVDRPLDVSFVIDHLEQVNSTQFNDQLNLKKIGIFGYSFGGTTAMALGGAQINFAQLAKDCNPPNSLTNISILYQCRALELPNKDYQLQDDRIQAAFVFVPFGKSLYGQTQMKYPIAASCGVSKEGITVIVEL